jgi:hypothetical protein
MAGKRADNSGGRFDMATALKGWMMVALTSTFALLYCGALLGWVKPLADERMLSRIEPIIFVIIGYYFGRLPSQQNEKALKEEISRQTQKADAAQHAKEQAQQARESLEEKVKNARVVLVPQGPGAGVRNYPESPDRPGGAVRDDPLRQSMAAALNILNT